MYNHHIRNDKFILEFFKKLFHSLKVHFKIMTNDFLLDWLIGNLIPILPDSKIKAKQLQILKTLKNEFESKKMLYRSQ